jgi:H+/gluconate symporter-like permease
VFFSAYFRTSQVTSTDVDGTAAAVTSGNPLAVSWTQDDNSVASASATSAASRAGTASPTAAPSAAASSAKKNMLMVYAGGAIVVVVLVVGLAVWKKRSRRKARRMLRVKVSPKKMVLKEAAPVPQCPFTPPPPVYPISMPVDN